VDIRACRGRARDHSTMQRVIGAVVACALVAGCGRGDLDTLTRERLDDAATGATQALDEVDALESRVDALASSFADDSRDDDRIDEKVKKLRQTLRDLRASLKSVRSSAGSAASEAGSALAEAQELARDLAVLEQRYEYHLRRYHGGG
jgi:outer membrane murein-binding lipoprotein Lpp